MNRIELTGYVSEQDGKLWINEKNLAEVLDTVFGSEQDIRPAAPNRHFGYLTVTIEDDPNRTRKLP